MKPAIKKEPEPKPVPEPKLPEWLRRYREYQERCAAERESALNVNDWANRQGRK